MQVKISLNRSVHQNAEKYFEKAKKLKAKLPGVEETIQRTEEELKHFEERKTRYLQRREQEQKIAKYHKKEWYHKFRHTWTSDGFLVVIGKDAGTNENLVKKHTEEDDLVLHSHAPGSPFGVIKQGREHISQEGIEEAAQFLLCFSKQWKAGFGTADGFWVYPEQVTKKTKSGEFMNKGSFMTYGDVHHLKNIPLQIGLGVIKKTIETEDETLSYETLFSGSAKACQTYCYQRYVKIEPGNQNYKAMTKELKKRLKATIEDLPHYIPNDGKILKK